VQQPVRVCPRHPPCKSLCHRLTGTKPMEDGYISFSRLSYGTGLTISGSDSCVESRISLCAKLTSAGTSQLQTPLACAPGMSLSPSGWTGLACRGGRRMTASLPSRQPPHPGGTAGKSQLWLTTFADI